MLDDALIFKLDRATDDPRPYSYEELTGTIEETIFLTNDSEENERIIFEEMILKMSEPAALWLSERDPRRYHWLNTQITLSELFEMYVAFAAFEWRPRENKNGDQAGRNKNQGQPRA